MQGTAFDIGILITAILAVIGYFFKLGLERRETARTLLFHLLEIRHELLIERPRLSKLVDDFSAEMLDLVGDRPHLNNAIVDQLPRAQIASILTSMVDGLVRADQALLQSYELALFSYSRIDPLICHNVRGMKLLPTVSLNFSEAVSSFEEMIPTNHETQVVKKMGQQEVRMSMETTVGELMSELETIIRQISCKAGICFWFNVRRLLKRKPEPEEDDGFNQLNMGEVMERLFKALMLANCSSDDVKPEIEGLTLEQILDLFESKLSEAADSGNA